MNEGIHLDLDVWRVSINDTVFIFAIVVIVIIIMA